MKRVDAAAFAVASLALLAGCAAAPPGPVPIAQGTDCHVCGMSIQNLRYACERRGDDGMNMFDSIECLVRDTTARGPVWLTDYDTQSLHLLDSMWIVQGDIPSPMGGGLAAFMQRDAADEVARSTAGRVFPGGDLLQSPGGVTL